MKQKKETSTILLRSLGFLGWLLYFIGCFIFFMHKIPDIYYSTLGIVICVIGIIVLHFYIKQKGFTGKQRLFQGIDYITFMIFIPGVMGLGLIGYNPPLMVFCYLMVVTAVILFALSILLHIILDFKDYKKKNQQSE